MLKIALFFLLLQHWLQWFLRCGDVLAVRILVFIDHLNIFVNKDFFPIKNLKIKDTKFEFSTSIGRGREVEFYNSLIFSLDVRKKNKFVNLISGGRFDELTSKFLGLKKVPAVGAAVNLSNYE